MKISASILSCDFSCISKEIDKVNFAGIDFIHLDIMDGHFVPNISFGAHVSRCVKKVSEVPAETHLMVSHPMDFVEKFDFSDTIIFHFESEDDIEDTVNLIKKFNIKAGISIRPKTDIEKILPYIENVDLVLVMTVEPGFGGQKFMEPQVEKIKYLKDFKSRNNFNFDIEVDGGINNVSARICEDNGADIVVAGTYIFNSEDVIKSVNLLRGQNG